MVNFSKALRRFCGGLKSDFFLYGEFWAGDYRRILNGECSPSCTNYECSKGLWSSFNDKIFLKSALPEPDVLDDPYALYRGGHLFSFVDNHDVTRLASNLKDGRCPPGLRRALCHAGRALRFTTAASGA